MRGLLVVVCLAIAVPVRADDRAPRVAEDGDAFVAHQAGTETWSIGSANLEVVIGLDAARTLAIQGMRNPSTDRTWDVSPAADATIAIDGQRLPIGATGGFTFTGAVAQTREHG